MPEVLQEIPELRGITRGGLQQTLKALIDDARMRVVAKMGSAKEQGVAQWMHSRRQARRRARVEETFWPMAGTDRRRGGAGDEGIPSGATGSVNVRSRPDTGRAKGCSRRAPPRGSSSCSPPPPTASCYILWFAPDGAFLGLERHRLAVAPGTFPAATIYRMDAGDWEQVEREVAAEVAA
jgi:hypothetical protein